MSNTENKWTAVHQIISDALESYESASSHAINGTRRGRVEYVHDRLKAEGLLNFLDPRVMPIEPSRAYLELREKPDPGCNRHVDCMKAEAEWLANHRDAAYVPAGYHCHDDCCEDCFGA